MRTVNVPQDIKDKIIYNYNVLGYGQIKSGASFGCGPHIVKSILREVNIPIRDFSHAATISNKNRAIGINHNYFDYESPNMAYILGLLASDGSVGKETNIIKLTLQAVDESFLQIIKEELEYEGEIKTYITKQGFSNSTLQFTSEKIKRTLATYNIVPSKTYTFQFPAKLQRKYWRDFFRGYFDGDGTICTAGDALRLSMISYLPNVLEVFINFFFEDYNIPKVNIQIREKENINYYFQYSTNAVRQFYKALYYDNCLCLPRKYDKFTELVNKFSTRL